MLTGDKSAGYRIIIGDDHALFRQSIAKVLRNMPGITQVEEAANGREVLEKIQAQDWDLLLLDIEMPKMDGFSTLIALKEHKSPPVIVVSMHADEETVSRAYTLGVKGYLHKDSETEELKQAIMAVLSGKHYFSQEVKGIILENVIEKNTLKRKTLPLSPQETEVLILICRQKTGKEIASELGISIQTVNTYRISLLRKTNSLNMAGLVIYAIDHGLYRT